MMYKFLVVSLLVVGTISLPQGAPPSVCQTMLPFHGGGIPAQTDVSPFAVTPEVTQIAEGSRLRVILGSRTGNQFGGFMLQARTVQGGQIIGSFVEFPANLAKSMQCSGPDDTVTHTNSGKKGPLEFVWQPPDGFLGDVIFNATVAEEYSKFWVGIESRPVQVARQSEVTGTNFPTTSNWRPTTTPPNYTPENEKPSGQRDDPFYKGCFVEKGCFGAPDGCVKTKNCKAVIASIVRGERYEFEMKAQKDSEYVAIGLSSDDKMGDDSVIECVRDRNGARVFMSRTIPRPNLNVERLARPQAGIEMINFNVTDGNLYCKVRRDIKTQVADKEYDLANQKFFLLVAAGSKVGANKVGFHDIAYLPSGESRFLTDVTEVGGASKLLLRLHGAFMLVAWVGTASVGILFARYFRQTWVGSQLCGKDQWFAWHRFFMVTTWTLTMVGFILIFVELKAWSSERNPHAILGLATTIICFLQPIGAFFRPHPGTPKRVLFNWIHWLGGNVAHILAIVTIFFAVKLNKAELPEWMDWLMVAFVTFHVCMHLIFSILGCASDRNAERRVTSFPMKDLGGNGRSVAHLDRKEDAPNATHRKVLLAIYLFVIILIVVAMVIVVVFAPIADSWASLKKNVMPE